MTIEERDDIARQVYARLQNHVETLVSMAFTKDIRKTILGIIDEKREADTMSKVNEVCDLIIKARTQVRV